MSSLKGFLLAAVLFVYGCESGPDNDTELPGTPGTRLKMIVGTEETAGAFPAWSYHFSYDDQNRLIKIGYKGGLADNITDYIAYQYEGSNTQPSTSTGLVEWSNHAENHYHFFTYNSLGQLVKDSQYINNYPYPNVTRSFSYSYTTPNNFYYDCTTIYNTTRTSFELVKDARGNITREKITLYPTTYLLTELEYDNKPNPLFNSLPKLYPQYLPEESPLELLGEILSTQKNNVTKMVKAYYNNGTVSGIPDEQVFEFLYNQNGLPAAILHKNASLGRIDIKYVFYYEN